jgi:large subunit ribosomal protein L21
MYAIISTGGKQYNVAEGDILDIELLPAKDKDGKEQKSTTISEVLVVGSGAGIQIGAPFVSGASVVLESVEAIRAPKVTAYKFKRRKGYHKTKGHKQRLTRVKVAGISTSKEKKS